MSDSLFTISNDLLDIINKLEEDELTDELLEKLAIREDNLRDKIADYLQVVRKYEADAKDCANEVARINQIKKVKTNTITRMRNFILDAVENFGREGKSGNHVIEGSTFKVYTQNRKSIEVDELWIRDIIGKFVEIVTEYLSSTEIQESLDYEYLAKIVEKYLQAENNDNRIVTKEDIESIDVDIIVSLKLSDLANVENFNLATWIGQHPNKISVSPNINKTLLKELIAMDTPLTLAHEVQTTSLIIK